MAALMEVTQADRDAAQRTQESLTGCRGTAIRDGELDSHWLVLSYVSHRLAHSEPRPVAGEIVAWLRKRAADFRHNAAFQQKRPGPRASGFEDAANEIEQHFATHSPAPTEAGSVRVPIKPTQAMREAATEIDIDTIVSAPTRLNWEEADAIYAAMLAAAPSTQGGAEA